MIGPRTVKLYDWTKDSKVVSLDQGHRVSHGNEVTIIHCQASLCSICIDVFHWDIHSEQQIDCLLSCDLRVRGRSFTNHVHGKSEYSLTNQQTVETISKE
ncbi:Hypothetical predicted protein [Octopus vulgaris]|uniref:Uncharacterized protein n=1 Tax=Octopus vulgaris TaxID=6645 RepID=A0AA36BZ63_OCTVU|nr:Hypothetical predicted protein [Octopus vulgaris]